MKQIKSFLKLSRKERYLFLEAVFFLFLSKLMLLFPFRWCIKWMKPASVLQVQASNEDLTRIRLAVSRANKLAFWKNICLVRSFAARWMLQRRKIGSVLHLGLQFKHGRELAAHAWLVSGDMQITPKGKINFKSIFSI